MTPDEQAAERSTPLWKALTQADWLIPMAKNLIAVDHQALRWTVVEQAAAAEIIAAFLSANHSSQVEAATPVDEQAVEALIAETIEAFGCDCIHSVNVADPTFPRSLLSHSSSCRLHHPETRIVERLIQALVERRPPAQDVEPLGERSRTEAKLKVGTVHRLPILWREGIAIMRAAGETDNADLIESYVAQLERCLVEEERFRPRPEAAPTEEPATWVQIQAGHELDKLIGVVRFAPGQPTGFLHSHFDARGLLWRWALKWAHDIATTRYEPRVPASQSGAPDEGAK